MFKSSIVGVCVCCGRSTNYNSEKFLVCYNNCGSFLHKYCSTFEPGDFYFWERNRQNFQWICDWCKNDTKVGAQKSTTSYSEMELMMTGLQDMLSDCIKLIENQADQVHSQFLRLSDLEKPFLNKEASVQTELTGVDVMLTGPKIQYGNSSKVTVEFSLNKVKVAPITVSNSSIFEANNVKNSIKPNLIATEEEIIKEDASVKSKNVLKDAENIKDHFDKGLSFGNYIVDNNSCQIGSLKLKKNQQKNLNMEILDGGVVFAVIETRQFLFSICPDTRAIEHELVDCFNESKYMSPYKYTIYISYLEIYNEVGYDLLNARHKATSHVEELPRIILLEDGKGESHIRNLTINPVATVQEAMRLLFLGDTNRTIVETPMNDNSSRSHCIFTIYICTRADNGNIRRSKLNLVDLAGSERIQKTTLTGQTLTEAKYINLSLLYLEQVITALGEAKRPHVPFRNSMMTYMLKDSLSGNCLSAMVATLSTAGVDLEETICTCKFAQRVALVNTEPVINEEIDFQKQLVFLRKENSDLRKQVFLLKSGVNMNEEGLSTNDKKNCREAVERFLNDYQNRVSLNIHDYNQIQYCFKLIKRVFQKERSERQKMQSQDTFSRDVVQKFKDVINQKDDEIFVLNELVDSLSKKSNISISDVVSPDVSMHQLSENELLSIFASDPDMKKEIDYFNDAIQGEYSAARKLSQFIEQCRDEIIDVRNNLEKNADEKSRYQMIVNLMRLQDYYRQTLLDLQNVKMKTDHLKHGLEQAQRKVWRKFNAFTGGVCGAIKELPAKALPTPNVEQMAKIRARLQSKFPFDKGDCKKRAFMNHPCEMYSVYPVMQKQTSDTNSINFNNCEDYLQMSPTKENTNCLFENQNYKVSAVRLANTKPLSERNLRAGAEDIGISMTEIDSKTDVDFLGDLSIDSLNNSNLPSKTSCIKSQSGFLAILSGDSLKSNKTNNSRFANEANNNTVPHTAAEFLDILTHSETKIDSQSPNRSHGNLLSKEILPKDSLEELHVTYPNEGACIQSSKDEFLEDFLEELGGQDFPPTGINQMQSHQSNQLLESNHNIDYNNSSWLNQQLAETSGNTLENPGSSKPTSFDTFGPLVRDSPADIDINIHKDRKTHSESSMSDVFEENRPQNRLQREGDTEEFLEFMKTVPLTGDLEVDDEIYNFYRDKFIR